ncbi:oxidoreductase family protein [Blastomonas fulva]|uniref:oxidoreductase family protein n=2 Tax=Blastomonas fulva TaxID=1550728 RepID=UPI004034926E
MMNDPQAAPQYHNPVVDPNCVPRPYPARTDHIPTTMNQIDAAWLSRMMGYKYAGVVARSMETVELLNSHTTKWRIRVDWNDAGISAGLPANLCMKANWSGSFHNVDIHALEARFYHFMVHEMKVPTARCYYADWDDDGKAHGFIVLEDLHDRGGRFGHSTHANGVEMIMENLEGLAKLHGSLWGSDKISPANAPWLQTQMDTPVDSDQVRIMWQWIALNLEDPAFRDIAPQHYLDDPKKVERAFDRLGEIERANRSPHCIVLGDCHQGNTYILPGGERLWLDWQLVRRGRPWRDLTYFIIGALSIEERRKHHKDMVKQYREYLIATGAQGVPDFEEAWEQTRLFVMYGLQAWVANLDAWGQNGVPMNERFFTAAEDYGTWKLLGE